MNDALEPGAPLRIRNAELLSMVASLKDEVGRLSAAVDAKSAEIRSLNQASQRPLSASMRDLVRQTRSAMDHDDARLAAVEALRDARSFHAAEKERQRARMDDERRVGEDHLQSVIAEKLAIISQQFEEILELKGRLLRADDGR